MEIMLPGWQRPYVCYGTIVLNVVVCILGASCGRDAASPAMYVWGTPDDVRCEWWVNGEPVTVTRSAVLMHWDGFLRDGSNVIKIVATGVSGERKYLAVKVRRVTDLFEKGVVVASIAQLIHAGQTVTATMTFVAARQKTVPLRHYDDVTLLSNCDTNILTMAIHQLIKAFANTNFAMFANLRVARLISSFERR